MEADLTALNRRLKPFCLDLSREVQDRILLFCKELLQWNDRFNLLSRPDAPNVVSKHVAASLGVLLVARGSPGQRWIDVGTGAGFPGLVLKMADPALDISLLESARKRCLFLESCIRVLHLGRVPIYPLRAETLIARGEGIGRYAIVTVRAVTSLAQTVSTFSPLAADGGRIITFKGPGWKDEVERAGSAGLLRTHGLEVETAVRIPWAAGQLVVLRKQAAGPLGVSPPAVGQPGSGTD